MQYLTTQRLQGKIRKSVSTKSQQMSHSSCSVVDVGCGGAVAGIDVAMAGVGADIGRLGGDAVVFGLSGGCRAERLACFVFIVARCSRARG